jgi:hypothetical protein
VIYVSLIGRAGRELIAFGYEKLFFSIEMDVRK